MKRIFQYKRMYLMLGLPLSALLILLARVNGAWVEAFFVRFIYRPLSFVIGSVSSLVPFSVTELLAVLGVGAVIFYLCRVIRRIVKSRRIKHELYRLFVNALCALSVAVFAFELCMGLNYYRRTAADFMGLSVTGGTTEELYELTSALAEDMKTYRQSLGEDENGAARLSDGDRYETSRAARDAYKKLSQKYGFLKAADIRNKPLVSSRLFSAFMTTGIYIPYTFESNINVDVPEFTIPATMCHELTHFRGFMRENEANFLGYLACAESDRDDFRYSAALMAFEYCYPKLRQADKELASKVARGVPEGVLRDIQAEDDYWARFEKKAAAQVSDKVYNGYLNFNGQQSGTQSYGEMVDLLLAYRRKNK